LLGALYSPLLAFVTLRATPAYLLVAAACFIRRSHPGRALGVAALAVGFHISAALALIPLLLTTYSNPGRAFSGRGTRRLDVWIVSAGVLLYTVWGGLSDFLPGISAFLEGQSTLAKFAIYAAGAGEMQSIMHRVYFAVALGAVIMLLISTRNFATRDVRYMTLSFLMYSALTVSPVVAFRQSIFWMMPLVLILPLERYIHSAAVSFAFCALCAVLYAVDFPGVLL
jgi:hypothetical protein